jgi:hypothetical protein
MAFELGDVRHAAYRYLDTVTVKIGPVKPDPGPEVNKPEKFSFEITVSNNPQGPDKGVPLKRLVYLVQIAYGSIVLLVPSGGNADDGSGNPLSAGDEVNAFTFEPAGDAHRLGTGETCHLHVTGKAIAPGACEIAANIQADIDVERLFTTDERTGEQYVSTMNFTVAT